MNQKKDGWDKEKIIAKTIGLILIPLIIGIVGFYINQSINQAEIRVRMLELGVDILFKTKTVPEDTTAEVKALRKWAIDIINEYSDIPLPDEVLPRLIEKPLIVGEARIGDRIP